MTKGGYPLSRRADGVCNLDLKEVPMSYVDGYVIPVPKKNLKAYTRMAKTGAWPVTRRRDAILKPVQGGDGQWQ